MNIPVTNQTMRSLKPICLLVVGSALVVFMVRTLNGHVWLDGLLTLALVQADSLPKLWTGITSGIDGNPPLFLTLAWLLTHALPAVAPATLLKFANVTMTVAAMVVLYRVSLRVVSAGAAWAGIFLFLALNETIIVVACELRTYALYLLLTSLTVLLQQRLIERRRTLDAVLLALACAALTLSHNFGIVYVGCIAIAGWLGQPSGRRHTRAAIPATAPAIVVMACWMPFFLQQSAVGQPYIWISPPTVVELLAIVFASPLAMAIALFELGCLALAAALFVRKHGIASLALMHRDATWQPQQYVIWLLLGIIGFTVAAWVFSVLLFPLFVARYFTPQLIASLALHMAFCELVMRMARKVPELRTPVLAAGAMVTPPAMFVMLLVNGPADGHPLCSDSTGAFFETAFAQGDLPVIAESPHVFMPRATYAERAGLYRFPLDWDVVLNYPNRGRGNATDFHVMENLKAWADKASIMTTDEIIRSTPQFLAIEQSGRAWFHHLRKSRDVAAEKLAEVTSPGGDTCTLWKVTGVRARL